MIVKFFNLRVVFIPFVHEEGDDDIDTVKGPTDHKKGGVAFDAGSHNISKEHGGNSPY